MYRSEQNRAKKRDAFPRFQFSINLWFRSLYGFDDAFPVPFVRLGQDDIGKEEQAEEDKDWIPDVLIDPMEIKVIFSRYIIII